MTRLSIFFSLALFVLIFANLGYLFEFSAWLGLVPLAMLIPLLFWLRRNSEQAVQRRETLFLASNQILLLLVALALSNHAWSILSQSSSSTDVGRLLPLFIAALALYLLHVSLTRLRIVEGSGVPYFLHLLTGPALLPTFCTALILTAFSLVLLAWLQTDIGALQSISVRFLERGLIPPLTLLLFFCGLLILCGKWGANWYLRKMLDGDFRTASMSRLAMLVSELHSVPRELVEDRLRVIRFRSEESYLIPRFISWAVPILGFIGTVLGISLAADGIRRIVSSEDGLVGLSSDLGQAIAPLGIAFDTTLIALSLSVVLTLVLTLVQRGEERVLAGFEEQVRSGDHGTRF